MTTFTPTSKRAGETRIIVVSFSEKLDTDETLSGTPTVTELGTTDLTITDETVTALEHKIHGVTIPTSEGVAFTVAGGTSRTDYTIRVIVDTSAGQVLVEDVRLAIL